MVAKFLIDYHMTGYDSEEKNIDVFINEIQENLNSNCSSVKVIPITPLVLLNALINLTENNLGPHYLKFLEISNELLRLKDQYEQYLE